MVDSSRQISTAMAPLNCNQEKERKSRLIDRLDNHPESFLFFTCLICSDLSFHFHCNIYSPDVPTGTYLLEVQSPQLVYSKVEGKKQRKNVNMSSIVSNKFLNIIYFSSTSLDPDCGHE